MVVAQTCRVSISEFMHAYTWWVRCSLSIGSAGQVLKVNSGGTAIEFGSVETVLNIDGATYYIVTDKFLVSDNGTEKKINAQDLKFSIADESSTSSSEELQIHYYHKY